MVGTNALILNFSDAALQKIGTLLLENSGNRFDISLKKPLPVSMALNGLHPESVSTTLTGIEGRIKSGIRINQQILGREIAIRAIIRIHFKNKLLRKGRNLLSRTKMIDFEWIEHPKLSVQNRFHANLLSKLDAIVVKLSAIAFSLIDRKIEEEINSENLNSSIGVYLGKTPFFRKWKLPKPSLALSNIRYGQSQFRIGIQMQVGQPLNGMGKTGNYQFQISYSMLDTFLFHTLKDKIGLWSLFRVSSVTTGLRGSVVETRVEFTNHVLGNCNIEWEFRNAGPENTILDIRRLRFRKLSFPKFVRRWILKRMIEHGKKIFNQIIIQANNEFAILFHEDTLNFEPWGAPKITAVSPQTDAIIVTVNEPKRINID